MRNAVASFLAFLLAVLPCAAQTSTPAPAPLVIPAGTVLSVVLTNQVSSTSTHSGDKLHLQLVAPVVTGSQIAIPAGTYLEGSIGTISQQDETVSLSLSRASLAFPGGYVAPVPGIASVGSSEGWWRPAPTGSHGAAVLLPLLLAPAVGAGIGAAVGRDGSLTPGSISGGQIVPGSITMSTRGRDAAIGFGIGAGVLITGLVAYFGSHHHSGPDFFFPAGAPMSVALSVPLPLDASQVAAAASSAVTVMPVAQPHMPPAPMPAPSSGLCQLPDTPGTPPTVIPGIPATPDNPGTPDTVIPGTPSIPGAVVPCS
jgi:hypothetical protein